MFRVLLHIFIGGVVISFLYRRDSDPIAGCSESGLRLNECIEKGLTTMKAMAIDTSFKARDLNFLRQYWFWRSPIED